MWGFCHVTVNWQAAASLRWRAPLSNLRDMPPRPSPSQSAEDYLERIHELIEGKGYARVADIATSLKVKRASVTSMVQRLAEEGYLQSGSVPRPVAHRPGPRRGPQSQSRHATLSRFFSLFDVDAEAQRLDIEGIEHHLSPATMEMLEDLARFFEGTPELVRAFRRSRQARRAEIVLKSYFFSADCAFIWRWTKELMRHPHHHEEPEQPVGDLVHLALADVGADGDAEPAEHGGAALAGAEEGVDRELRVVHFARCRRGCR